MKSSFYFYRCIICATLALFLLTTSGRAQTAPEQMDAILDASAILDLNWSILFENSDGSVEYYSRDPDVQRVPASNQKMLTTAAAFGLLRTDHTFRTRVYYDGTLNGGVLNGNIILLGEHDITWNSSVLSPSDAALDLIATQVRNFGITEVNGNVRGYGAMFYNLGSTNAGHVSLSSGNIAELNRQAAVAFRVSLIGAGTNFPTVINSQGFTGFTPPTGSVLVHTHQSSDINGTFTGLPLTLDVACIGLNKPSHNPMADFLLRHIGYQLTGTDTYDAGEAQALAWFANTAGLDTTGMVMADGSGLSRNNRVSGRQLVDITRYMVDNFTTWDDTLPISGVDGTLAGRLGGSLFGDVHAKTGTLGNSGSVTLSGYIDNPNDGRRYYFSMQGNTAGILEGGQAINTGATRAAIDDCVRVIGDNRPALSAELLAVRQMPNGNIRIEWDESDLFTESYKVLASTDGGPFTELATINPSYIIESGNAGNSNGINNSDYSDSGSFRDSASHSEAPGLTPGIGSRFVLRTDGLGTATYTPSGLAEGRYRVDVTCFDFTSADAANAEVTIQDRRGTTTSFFELSQGTGGDVWRNVGTFDFQPLVNHRIEFRNNSQINTTDQDRLNPAALRFTPLYFEDSTVPLGAKRDYRVITVGARGIDSPVSDTYSARKTIDSPQILIVDGYDRWMTQSQNTNRVNHDFVARTAESIGPHTWNSIANEALLQDIVSLSDYPVAIYVLGEESSVDETFDSTEQPLITSYINGGGNLFLSGGEIAWDLDRDSGPSAADRAFINNTLRADLGGNANDDADTYDVVPTAASIFDGIANFSFDNGSNGTYNVEFPDILVPTGAGSSGVMDYTGGRAGKAATIYDGSAGGGKIVFLGFPFETVISKSSRDEIMERILSSFFGLPEARITIDSTWFFLE
jgi:D-alanyl-D-alanine carboxypeptidase